MPVVVSFNIPLEVLDLAHSCGMVHGTDTSRSTPVRLVIICPAHAEHGCTADVVPIGRTIRRPVRASSPISPSTFHEVT